MAVTPPWLAAPKPIARARHPLLFADGRECCRRDMLCQKLLAFVAGVSFASLAAGCGDRVGEGDGGGETVARRWRTTPDVRLVKRRRASVGISALVRERAERTAAGTDRAYATLPAQAAEGLQADALRARAALPGAAEPGVTLAKPASTSGVWTTSIRRSLPSISR